MGFKDLADVHPRRHAERVEADIDGSSVSQIRHIFLGHDRSDNALVTVTTGHLVTHGKLPFRGDEDLHFLDDAGIDFITGLKRIELPLALGVEFLEATFKRTDDLQDLVTDRGRINFDMVVDGGELPKQRFGDLPVRRNDDFTGLRIDHIERDFLSQQNVG